MYDRYSQEGVEGLLEMMPAVLIRGARQTGKTTLVEFLMQKNGWTYVTFDDELVLSEAKRRPDEWLNGMPKPLIIDEVQRLPEIFRTIKKEIDQDRRDGQYLLTGSADPLLLPRMGDSLAGRLGIVDLYPLSQVEIQRKASQFTDRLFTGDFSATFSSLCEDEFISMLLRGGFPVPLKLNGEVQIKNWLSSYLQTLLERDVRDIARVEGLREFPRLMQLLAIRSSTLLNTSEISRTLGMVNMTIKRYMSLLEALFFITLLPGWYSNLGKRIIKTPKVHLCDTGLLSAILDIDVNRVKKDRDLLGRILETFVFNELQKQRSWARRRFQIYHFRDGSNEVDFILETPAGEIIGIEVKSARKLQSSDFRGLKHLAQIAGKNFLRGVVLYLGDEIKPFSTDLMAVPVQALWE